MGVQHNFYSLFLPRAAQSTTRLTEAELRGAAATTQEQEEWVQLDHNLKYVLIITTTAAAATLCRQYQHEIGLEIYRQLLLRFKTPLGTRSIGYLTKLLEPTFDTNNFEESFSNWEYEIQQYESDNSTRLPDQVKVGEFWWTEQEDHCNNTYISVQEHPQRTRRYGQQSLNIKEHIQPSAGYNRIHHQQSQQTTMEEQHQWT